MALYRWLATREACTHSGQTDIRLGPLYDYAGFPEESYAAVIVFAVPGALRYVHNGSLRLVFFEDSFHELAHGEQSHLVAHQILLGFWWSP